ncbi:MAG: dihydroxyacetone kinase subunit L [Candidatus Marinimicrobia bacterium]|nr:dihydroxyacetone kinase subunit L [Candidatus Neomarinimicrobiota bacterium]|tara:strand:- start:15135 stop:15788 length:654 start_codon:yes stop_codon:yes gene_type:complete
MKKNLTTEEFIKILYVICDDIEKNKDYFSELDRATGDGDHGVTMSIGWTAVREKLVTLSDNLTFDKICMQVASSFLSAVGASAGPLYATALMRGGAKLKDLQSANASQIADFFEAAANGIKERGKAELGDKTMLDVWIPSAETIKKTSIDEEDIIEILEQGALKANQAMQSTKEMLSKKGRSSKLGERSKGHIDPGAASSAMIINTFFEAIKKLDSI